jgi:hypothetical protein
MQYKQMNKNILHQKPRVLDQVRERLRYKRYSLSTEKVYVYWIRFSYAGLRLRHSSDLLTPEVKAFSTMLATEH